MTFSVNVSTYSSIYRPTATWNLCQSIMSISNKKQNGEPYQWYHASGHHPAPCLAFTWKQFNFEAPFPLLHHDMDSFCSSSFVAFLPPSSFDPLWCVPYALEDSPAVVWYEIKPLQFALPFGRSPCHWILFSLYLLLSFDIWDMAFAFSLISKAPALDCLTIFFSIDADHITAGGAYPSLTFNYIDLAQNHM